MTKPEVIIIDYGVGNLLSVQRAFEECGVESVISDQPNEIFKAKRVILPGVGAFAMGMQSLQKRGLIEVIQNIAFNGVPILGICLGMQLLFDESQEFGFTQGLGLISGRVVPVSSAGLDGKKIRIPHIGWNSLIAETNNSWNATILRGINPGDAVYFVHSYMVTPSNPGVKIANCLYGENQIPAIIQHNNIVGCQFHPEKSGKIGLSILRNFMQLQ